VPSITIFYADTCPLCHNALKYFRGRGLDVDAREVFWDEGVQEFVDSENTREMCRRAGKTDFVPQIFIDGRHIAGWRKLEPMIESGEIESYLKQQDV
jgi:glutaredoxin